MEKNKKKSQTEESSEESDTNNNAGGVWGEFGSREEWLASMRAETKEVPITTPRSNSSTPWWQIGFDEDFDEDNLKEPEDAREYHQELLKVIDGPLVERRWRVMYSDSENESWSSISDISSDSDDSDNEPTSYRSSNSTFSWSKEHQKEHDSNLKDMSSSLFDKMKSGGQISSQKNSKSSNSRNISYEIGAIRDLFTKDLSTLDPLITKKIIKCQSTIRSWLLRRKLKSDPYFSKRKKQLDILKTLYFSERSYVRSLKFINDNYLVPLTQSAARFPTTTNISNSTKSKFIISQDGIKKIFSCLELIYKLHSELFLGFRKKLYDLKNANFFWAILDEFKKFGYFFKMYSDYVINYEISCKTLDGLKKSKQWQRFLKCIDVVIDKKKMAKRFYAKNLSSQLLILPIERISKYHRLLTELNKSISESESDLKKNEKNIKKMKNQKYLVNSSLEIVNQTMKTVKDKRRHDMHVNKMHQIQKRIINFNVLSPGRRLVREGYLIDEDMKNSDDLTKFLLFNDILLYTVVSDQNIENEKENNKKGKEHENENGKKLEVVISWKVADLKVKEISGSFVFTLKSEEKGRSYNLKARNWTKKKQWVDDILKVRKLERKKMELFEKNTEIAAKNASRHIKKQSQPNLLQPSQIQQQQLADDYPLTNWYTTKDLTNSDEYEIKKNNQNVIPQNLASSGGSYAGGGSKSRSMFHIPTPKKSKKNGENGVKKKRNNVAMSPPPSPGFVSRLLDRSRTGSVSSPSSPISGVKKRRGRSSSTAGITLELEFPMGKPQKKRENGKSKDNKKGKEKVGNEKRKERKNSKS